MARTRGGMNESQNRGVGRGRARGKERVLGVQSEDVRIEGAEDRKSTRLNSSHSGESRMPSSA